LLKILKRFFAISLLALYINSYTEFHEALRLPVLFEHYAEHKSLVSDISFWEFLVMHYKSDVNHDDHDGQLPFKVPGHSFVAAATAIPATKIIVKEVQPQAEITHFSFYEEAPHSSYLQKIFQPPRA
jgi:hypothetical protein